MGKVYYVEERLRGPGNVYVFEEEAAGWIPFPTAYLLSKKLATRILHSLYCRDCHEWHEHPAVVFPAFNERGSEPGVIVRGGGVSDPNECANSWVEIICPRGHQLCSDLYEY